MSQDIRLASLDHHPAFLCVGSLLGASECAAPCAPFLVHHLRVLRLAHFRVNTRGRSERAEAAYDQWRMVNRGCHYGAEGITIGVAGLQLRHWAIIDGTPRLVRCGQSAGPGRIASRSWDARRKGLVMDRSWAGGWYGDRISRCCHGVTSLGRWRARAGGVAQRLLNHAALVQAGAIHQLRAGAELAG